MTDVSSYSYDSAKKELVSYDTPNIAGIKAKYVKDNALGGSMFWDVSNNICSVSFWVWSLLMSHDF